jgi:hypothetical protein
MADQPHGTAMWYDSGEAALNQAIDSLTAAIKRKEEEEKKRKKDCGHGGGKIDCVEPSQNRLTVNDIRH